jgi:hypothetical protein
VIAAVELAMLLRGSDRDANLDALASLFADGLVTPVTDRDMIVVITTTAAGAAKLNGMMLPPASA